MFHHNEEQLAEKRAQMIEAHLKHRGISDKKLIDVMSRIQRELFVLPQDTEIAYEDYPLPIGYGQTISQPYIVAFMIEQLDIKPTDIVLEIGTGSGYNAAVMGELAKTVYTLEIVKELYDRTSKLLKRLNHKNVVCMLRDGHDGLPEKAPFDKIILTAAPEKIPHQLLDQLKIKGRLIAPLGRIRMFQKLTQIDKLAKDRFKETELMGVSFVEMVRENL